MLSYGCAFVPDFLVIICEHCSVIQTEQGADARSDAHPPGMLTVAGSIHTSGKIFSWKLVMK